MLKAIVVTILEDKIVVIKSVGCGHDISILSMRSYLEAGCSYCVNFKDGNDKITVLKKLIEMGALFSYGQGWAPSQVMDYLKERGEINMPYKEIVWNGPGDFVVRER